MGYVLLMIFGIFFYCFDKEMVLGLLLKKININLIVEFFGFNNFDYIFGRDIYYLKIIIYVLILLDNSLFSNFLKFILVEKVMWDKYMSDCFG